MIRMAPRNPITDVIPSSDDGDGLGLDQVSPVITEENYQQKQQPLKIVWQNVFIQLGIHLAALYGLIRIPWSHPLTWLWTIFYYIFSAVGITAGAHRLWSHRSYKAKTPLRILLAMMNSAALQNDILEWTRDHRVHHKYSETDADPHNARRGFFFSHIGWLLVRKHPDVARKGKQLDLSDLYADKVVMIQRRYYRLSIVIMCFIVPTVVPYYLWGESLINAFFISSILRYVLTLNATWLVNSAAHMWGNRPYDKNINPAQNRGVAFSAVGEGFHNYHHTFPHDYGTSEFGWHLNITTAFIDFFALLGQVSDRRKISHATVERRKARTGDGS
ncbi:stearoyl-CoA desaturase 5-like [Mytilus californianus]|uniref:stearoyl-CoA desaturase 5-like n=1 Tax=Mytilus californianus TaxID=6549 RepID=UPI002247E62D|nr:stearoyl-CoA desaturase 5-like [Mytilus californianus]